jgi:hypothetical protein
MPAITCAVAMNKVTTIRSESPSRQVPPGCCHRSAAAHAVIVAAFSEPHDRKDQQEKTIVNMIAATASTKRESPKIEIAGVEMGEKIFVGLRANAKCTENPPMVHSRTWDC